MRTVYITTCLISFWLITGCSGQRFFIPIVDDRGLPSLHAQSSRHVIQVAANFDNTTQRDHPYFVVCEADDCPAITPKTLLSSTASKAVSPRINTTYLKKETTLLEQFRVHFEYSSAELSNTNQSLLKSFVDNYPHQQKVVRVTGFTDNGSKPDGAVGNEWLALERALSVKKHLINLGYPESQVLLEAKFLCCYIDSNESEAGRLNNRRAELSLIHNLIK